VTITRMRQIGGKRRRKKFKEPSLEYRGRSRNSALDIYGGTDSQRKRKVGGEKEGERNGSVQ